MTSSIKKGMRNGQNLWFVPGTNERITYNKKDALGLGLQTATRALIDESVFARSRVHFNYSITHSALYYSPLNGTFA